jgi:basic membrane protein A
MGTPRAGVSNFAGWQRTLAIALAALPLSFAGLSAARAADALKIAVLSSGSATDGGWNQLAAEALTKIEKDMHVDGKFVEKVSPDKAPDLMHDLASQGYSLIIGHGYEFFTPAKEVAKTETDTHIAVSGSSDKDDHVASMDFDISQSCYQLGIIAAKVSKTGKIGFIGGERIPSLESCFRGLVAGAKSVNPKIEVLEAYTSWDKPEDSKSQTETYIHQGVDVIFQDVDAASRGVFEAVKEHNQQQAQSNPVYAFGSNSNQNGNPICSDYTLASAVIKLDKAFGEMATRVQTGRFVPGVIEENLTNGVCVTEINPKLSPAVITPEIQTLIDKAGQQITDGTIKIPTANP